MISLRLTLILIVVLAVVYPLLVAMIGKLTPGRGDGGKLFVNGKTVGYSLIGQRFTEDRYFWGRPSAVDYNAGGSAGSNKGATNPDYLKIVQGRIDTFLAHNPGIMKAQIPAEMVTASGSGLDPDISPSGALVQVKRIARDRNIDEAGIVELVNAHTERPFMGIFGPSKVNVLKLNIALDQLK